MVTLDVRHRGEEKTTVEEPEPADSALAASNVVDQGRAGKSTWSYWVPFPGVRYYSFGRPRPGYPPGKPDGED